MSKSKPRTTPGQETLQQLLLRLNIPLDNWDVVLVGDGSGSKWNYSVGWGCVAIHRNRMEREVFYGGMNDGTVNIAEAMAYLAPLSKYAAEVAAEDKERRRNHPSTPPATREVHIITDSEYTRRRGEGTDSVNFKKNAVLWAGYEMFNRQGIFLHWHHLPREDAELNHYADLLSKESRMLVKQNNLEAKLLTGGQPVDHFNPEE